ncbi:hypothetical protein SAMN03159453_00411 [Pseudomonas sp. NFIX28]|nr:hypothetical protein SAMN03159453_00411 [Pseudomonas sp. NFIX28]
MTRSHLWQYVIVLLLILMHAGYSILERPNLNESYFSRGVVLLEDGESLTQSARLQFRDNMIYDYQQIDNSARILPLKIKNSAKDSFYLTTTPTNNNLTGPSKKYTHSQLAYNQAYYSKENMPLTFYRVPTPPDVFCIYIGELKKLRCFGMAQ